MTDLRWAIMGAGRFARSVMPRLRDARGCRITAVASRDAARARASADAAGLAHAVACAYDEALTRDDVDAVYLSIPNQLHVESCLKALRAGKHVLCEKPLCWTRAQAELIAQAAAATGKLCAEGFMYMHHPQTDRLVELTRPDSPLGRITAIRSNRNVLQTDPAILSTRLSHILRGGALMDIGCYPLSLALLVADQTPDWTSLRARADFARWVGDDAQGFIEWTDGRRQSFPPSSQEPPSQPANSIGGAWRAGFVDESCEFAFDFPSGVRFEGACSFTRGMPNGGSVLFELIGERGRAVTTFPFSPDPARQTLSIVIDGVPRDEVFLDAGDKFTNQFERFAAAVRGDRPALPDMKWSIIEASAIEQIHRAIGLRWD